MSFPTLQIAVVGKEPVPADLVARLQDNYLEQERDASSSEASSSEDVRSSLPYIHAERALTSNGLDRDLGAHALSWARRLQQYERFILEHQRMPRENNRDPGSVGPEEQSLHFWVRHMRTRHRERKLTSYQVQRLELLGSWWTWAPHHTQWVASYTRYKAFLLQHNRSPTDRRGEEERRLAQWATAQRRSYTRNRLDQERIELLEALPVWAWTRRRTSD
jgi:hypothetical protein